MNAHSSIRLACVTGAGEERVVYVDPYLIDPEHRVPTSPHDADAIFFTHSHYDHFSPDDAAAVAREDGATIYVMPASMVDEAQAAGIPEDAITALDPDAHTMVLDLEVYTVRAYNPRKDFHPKENNWLGYVITAASGVRVYITGDTDANPDCCAVRCEIVCLPVGGKYTMNVPEAGAMVNIMRGSHGDGKPEVAIPTHYGSVAGTPLDGENFARLLRTPDGVVIPY